MAKVIILREFRCKRCDRTFHSASRQPRSCGKCKSKYWNLPRVRRRRAKSSSIAGSAGPSIESGASA